MLKKKSVLEGNKSRRRETGQEATKIVQLKNGLKWGEWSDKERVYKYLEYRIQKPLCSEKGDGERRVM